MDVYFYLQLIAKVYWNSQGQRYVRVRFAAFGVIVVFDIGAVYASSESIANSIQ